MTVGFAERDHLPVEGSVCDVGALDALRRTAGWRRGWDGIGLDRSKRLRLGGAWIGDTLRTCRRRGGAGREEPRQRQYEGRGAAHAVATLAGAKTVVRSMNSRDR